MSSINRDIEAIHCSCGGVAVEVDTTDKEEEEHGCGMDKGCCVKAFQCSKCQTRWTFALCAPEFVD